MSKKKELGTIDEFHCKSCFSKYLKMVAAAKEINKLIEAGYLILDQKKAPIEPFVFYAMNEPTIAMKHQYYEGQTNYFSIACSTYEDSKIWMHDDSLEFLNTLTALEPKYIKKIKLKGGKVCLESLEKQS